MVIVGTVGCKEECFHAAGAQAFFNISKVLAIVTVATVFVFHLHGNDGPAAGGLQRDQPFHQRIEEAIDSLQVRPVRAAHLHARIFQQPGGQAAEIPFRADIRSRADNDFQAEVCRGLDEANDIQHAVEMEFAGVGFVQVPRDIGFDRVQSESFGLFKPVAPVFGHDPEIMDRAGKDAEGLAVEQELVA